MAYLVTEPDAPHVYALITDPEGAAMPEHPEVDEMLIGIYHEDQGEDLGLTEVTGRAGLIEWYEANVGYSPDEELSSPTPILVLMDRVASHLLLRAHAKKSA